MCGNVDFVESQQTLLVTHNHTELMYMQEDITSTCSESTESLVSSKVRRSIDVFWNVPIFHEMIVSTNRPRID